MIVVLGMHKSGTTLLAKILHHSGIDMGKFDPAIGYDDGNQYERDETQQINKAMLNCGNTLSIYVRTPLSPSYVDKNLEDRMQMLIEGQKRANSIWGFKDPRTCLTYHVWRRHLPEHQLLGIFRPSREVFAHYLKDIPRHRYIKRFIRGYNALVAWAVYNQQLLSYHENSGTNSILISYPALMQDKNSLSTLGDHLQLELKDLREPKMYRARSLTTLEYRLCSALTGLTQGLSIKKIDHLLNKSSRNFAR